MCFSAAHCSKRAPTHNLDWHAGVVRLLCKVALPVAQLPVRAVAWGVAVAEVAVHQLAEPSAQMPTTLTHQACPAHPSTASRSLPQHCSCLQNSPAGTAVLRKMLFKGSSREERFNAQLHGACAGQQCCSTVRVVQRSAPNESHLGDICSGAIKHVPKLLLIKSACAELWRGEAPERVEGEQAMNEWRAGARQRRRRRCAQGSAKAGSARSHTSVRTHTLVLRLP